MTPVPSNCASETSGYFDSLALADVFLGKLREAMQAGGLWDRIWLIVTADHSWRESRIYDGRRDYRVPFLLKAPATAAGATYCKPLNTVLTHDLILAILRGEISGQAQALAWLDVHSAPLPPVLTCGQKAEIDALRAARRP